MFKRLAIVMLACAALAIPAAAQNTPQAEVFAGYSFMRFNPGQGNSGENIPAGWHASVAGNINDWFGIVGEVSGHYKEIGGVDFNGHTFTFGPRISSRSNENFTPFAHATFGGMRVGASAFGAGASDSAFAMTFGGGVDVKATDRIAVRITQFDYITTRFDVTGTGATWQHNFRWSAGVVFRVGSK